MFSFSIMSIVFYSLNFLSFLRPLIPSMSSFTSSISDSSYSFNPLGPLQIDQLRDLTSPSASDARLSSKVGPWLNTAFSLYYSHLLRKWYWMKHQAVDWIIHQAILFFMVHPLKITLCSLAIEIPLLTLTNHRQATPPIKVTDSLSLT